jgi:hypothetical protein
VECSQEIFQLKDNNQYLLSQLREAKKESEKSKQETMRLQEELKSTISTYTKLLQKQSFDCENKEIRASLQSNCFN